MRIVTRPDFDGVVCAMLIYEAENINEPVKWVQPNDMQKGLVTIRIQYTPVITKNLHQLLSKMAIYNLNSQSCNLFSIKTASSIYDQTI